MKKYKFERKLKKAVLVGKDSGYATFIIEGVKKKVKCPVPVRIGPGEISCLLAEEIRYGSIEYAVIAVSFDDLDKKEKDWICIQPALLEQAISFFIENHQMESMSEACRCASRLADAKDSGVDFETEDAEIEIKVPLVVPNAKGSDSCIWKGFHPAVKQMIGYCNSSYAKEKGKRIELLTICQHGTNNILAVTNENMKKELEKAVRMGIEFWIAETKTEPDGISLLEYRNFTSKILKS